MTAVFGITAAALAALALLFILARRIPGWQGPGHHTPAAVERDRDGAWMAELDTMTMRHAPGPAVDRVREGSADLDQFLPPWGQAAAPDVTHLCPPIGEYFTPCCRQNPFDLPRTDRMTLDESLVTCLEAYLDPLPGPEYLTAPAATHAPPDVAPGRVHDGCEISDTGQQAALDVLRQRLQTPLDPAIDPYSPAGEPATLLWTPEGGFTREGAEHFGRPGPGCPAHGTELPPAGMASSEGLGSRPGDDATLARAQEDMAAAMRNQLDLEAGLTRLRAFRETITRWDLKAHVSYTMARETDDARFVRKVIGPGIADLYPAYAADDITYAPAEDFEQLLEKARAGAVPEGAGQS